MAAGLCIITKNRTKRVLISLCENARKPRRRILNGGNAMFAIIETGGKQYRVSEGDVLDVERLEAEVGAAVTFKVIMTGDGDNIVAGAAAESKSVTATVVRQYKAKKVVVFKYKAKKNVRKKQGHRQYYTRVKIESIA